jgi:hypothetical protein
MEKSTIVIIFLLFFLFSSRMWEITWDIGKALLYIIIGIFILNFLDKELSNNIKLIIIDLMNIDSYNTNYNQKHKFNNIIMDYISKLSNFLMGYLQSILENKNVKKLNEVVKENTDKYKPTNNFLNDNQYQSMQSPRYNDNL